MIKLHGSVYFLVSCIYFTTITDAYKILIYSPQLGHSHVTFMGSIADTLVSAGHDVLVYIPQANPNVTINGTKLARVRLKPLPITINALDHDNFQQEIWQSSSTSARAALKMLNIVVDLITNMCEQQIKDNELIDELRAEKFDLALAELWDPCSFGIFELAKIPAHIGCSATILTESISLIMGVPNAVSYVPGAFSMTTDRMSYMDRVINLINYAMMGYCWHEWLLTPKVTNIFRSKFGPNFIDLGEKMSRSSFAFINSNELIDFPRPISHRIIYIGGVNVPETTKPLHDQMKSIVDKSKRIILMSFGSYVQSQLMPDESKRAFINAFSHFPHVDFIWKYEIDDDEIAMNAAGNVHLFKWIPQNDLLNNDKVIAFITHAGLNSITEAFHSATPVISIPLFGDQMRNAKMIENRQIGVIVDKKNLSSQSIIDAIEMIINDNRYTTNVKRLSQMIRKKPFNYREQIVKYSEFAAEFGEMTHLDLYGRHLGFIQYFLLDIILPLFAIVIVFIYLLYRLICRLSKKLFVSKKSKSE